MKARFKVRLELGDRSYPIWVGPGTVGLAAQSGPRGSKAFIIADSRLRSHRDQLVRVLEQGGWSVGVANVAASERFKDYRAIEPIYGKLLKFGADRDTVVFALGGGVIGDAAGFIAGTYMRGIRWVGVPTTLLSQVDSSIGGKTGVNHSAGKNLIGVFHQPSAVLCDVNFLKTLPAREIVSGLGEMIKYGLIRDPAFFSSLERNRERVLGKDPRELSRAVARCARLKAQAVSADERDRLGVREVLNFGHTIGHALEAATGYGYYRHGEAVISGMRAATFLSVLRGHLSVKVQQRIESFLARLPVPGIPRGISDAEILAHLKHDKKSSGGRVRFVLLSAIGKTVSDRAVTDPEIRLSLKRLRASL